MKWLVLFALLVGSAQKPPPVAAVIPTRPAITGDAAHPELQFDVINNTDATVTAWGINIVVHLVNGSIDRSGTAGIGVDGYDLFAGVYEPAFARRLAADYATVVPPHSSVHFGMGVPLSVPASEIRNIDVTLRYAVFADRTWTGDERSVDLCFEDRQAQYETLRETIPILKDARTHHRGAEALQWALDELNKDARNMLKEGDRVTLRLALQGRNPQSPEELLSDLIARDEAKLRAVDLHRNKGPGATVK